MVTLKISDFIITGVDSDVKDFLLFRYIEEWCTINVPATKWKFIWATTELVYGVDVPAFIKFNHSVDAVTFTLAFKKHN